VSVTWIGPSSPSRPYSSFGFPIRNVPDGHQTIFIVRLLSSRTSPARTPTKVPIGSDAGSSALGAYLVSAALVSAALVSASLGASLLGTVFGSDRVAIREMANTVGSPIRLPMSLGRCSPPSVP
jgi:hypothetical protein